MKNTKNKDQFTTIDMHLENSLRIVITLIDPDIYSLLLQKKKHF